MEENKETKKLSYEQLENVANQLSMQLHQAKEQMNQMSGILTKLPYLFKVVENYKTFDVVLGDGGTFTGTCIKEIKDILEPEEESNDDKA